MFNYFLDGVFYCIVIVLFSGDKEGVDLGPLISKSAKERVERLIQSGIDEGASVRMCFLHSFISL